MCVSSSFIFFWGGMAEVSKRSPVNKRSNTKITLNPPPSLCVYFLRNLLARSDPSAHDLFFCAMALVTGKCSSISLHHHKERGGGGGLNVVSRMFPIAFPTLKKIAQIAPQLASSTGEIRCIVGEGEGGNFWTICGRRCMCIFFLFEFRLCLGARSTKRALVRISQLPHCPPPPQSCIQEKQDKKISRSPDAYPPIRRYAWHGILRQSPNSRRKV